MSKETPVQLVIRLGLTDCPHDDDCVAARDCNDCLIEAIAARDEAKS